MKGKYRDRYLLKNIFLVALSRCGKIDEEEIMRGGMMEHVLTVTNTSRKESALHLHPIENWPLSEWQRLKDGMRLLVDSEALTFVYVLDSDDAFVQLRLPRQVWPVLKEAYEKEWDVYASLYEPILLAHFHEEMEYVLTNIPGNGNYGKEMVEAVEEIFQVQP